MSTARRLETLLTGVSAVCFDLDGTLASLGWRKLRLGRALLDHGAVLAHYELSVRALRGARALDLAEQVKLELVRRSKRPRPEVDAALHATLETRWPQLFAGAHPPGPVAAPIAAADRRGLPRAVVSDYPALDKLAAMGLGGWTAVVDCRGLGAFKPQPDGLLAAAAQLGVAPAALLYVGDRWDTDGLAAARAGCRFAHLSTLRRP